MSYTPRLTFRTDYDCGTGSIGNMEPWSESINAVFAVDLLNDWIGDLEVLRSIMMDKVYPNRIEERMYEGLSYQTIEIDKVNMKNSTSSIFGIDSVAQQAYKKMFRG